MNGYSPTQAIVAAQMAAKAMPVQPKLAQLPVPDMSYGGMQAAGIDWNQRMLDAGMTQQAIDSLSPMQSLQAKAQLMGMQYDKTKDKLKEAGRGLLNFFGG
jgi:hypothetical protein